MTTALANVQYKPTELDTNTLGNVLVKSGYFQDTKDVAQAIVKVLAGRELGFGPIASMQGVYIVKGRVTLSANLVGAAIQRSGKYTYRLVGLTNEKCIIDFWDKTDLNLPPFTSEFTIQDAQAAGIAGDTYKKFPRNMLFARALTNGARWFCPEVFNGPVYTPDELGAIVDAEGTVIDAGDHQVNTVTGEVVEEAPADPANAAWVAAIDKWVETSERATELSIVHKDLPDNASMEQIARWTNALSKKIDEVEEF